MARERVANNRMRGMVIGKIPFTNANGTVIADWQDEPRCYVVYSYGHHFPMYVWMDDQWFGNESKYGVTTSKHQSLCCPQANGITWLDTSALIKLTQGKSWSALVYKRKDEDDLSEVQDAD